MGKPRYNPAQVSSGKNKKHRDSDMILSNGDEDDNRGNGSDDGDEMDKFYQERDDRLQTALAKNSQRKSKGNKKSVSWAIDNNSSDGEGGRDEVLAFDDDDDGSMASGEEDDNEYQQLEGDEEEEAEEDLSGAWGSARKTFYNEDVNGDDEDAQLEEQEAVQIQKRYYDMLQTDDFGLNLFRQSASIPSDTGNLDELSSRHHIILPDNLLEMSSTERLQFVRDQSPELEPLCSEFKRIFDDLKIYLLPLVQLVNDTSSNRQFQAYNGWQFVLCTTELYLTYCSYLSLYMTMKSTDGIDLRNHPLMEDISQYGKLCQLIRDDFELIKPDLLQLCEMLKEKKKTITNLPSIALPSTTTTNGGIKPRPHMGVSLPTNGATAVPKKTSLRERMMTVKKQQTVEPTTASIDDDVEKPQKRGITYEIEKNKGLTAKRKKECRNPRVRHRNKYARALSKRTSRVPTARTESEKYTGEPTGIRAGLKRGIKLK